MPTFFAMFIKTIDAINRFFFIVGSFLSICLVILTAQQVCARYFFDAGSVGIQELEWHLFGFLILLSMAHALKKDDHVRVDIFYSKLSRRMRAIVDTFGLVTFLLPVTLILTIYGYNFMLSALAFENPHPDNYWTASLQNSDSFVVSIARGIELFLRQNILLGEVSSDPGGLEARWIIKGAIPFGFALLFLQGISEVTKKVSIIYQPEKTDGY